MSLWIEIHCDHNKPKCYSDNAKQVSAMVSKACIAPRAIARLTRQAQQEGWKKTRGKWTCPTCAKEPT